MPEEESHKTTAELDKVIQTVEEQCVKAIINIDKKLDAIKTDSDSKHASMNKRMNDHSDEINREIPAQIKSLIHSIDKVVLVQKGHNEQLKEAADNKRFFGKAAITFIFTIGAGAIAAWWNAGFGGKS